MALYASPYNMRLYSYPYILSDTHNRILTIIRLCVYAKKMKSTPMEQIARTSKQIGAAVRRVRRAARLSQGELGAKTNLRQATVSALENGEPGTQLRTMIDVMTALGLEMVIRERSKSGESIEDLF